MRIMQYYRATAKLPAQAMWLVAWDMTISATMLLMLHFLRNGCADRTVTISLSVLLANGHSRGDLYLMVSMVVGV
jgi:hypothetical protein